MRKVTKDEFFKAIGPLDVVVSVHGDYPYTTEFRLRAGRLVGKIDPTGYYVTP